MQIRLLSVTADCERYWLANFLAFLNVNSLVKWWSIQKKWIWDIFGINHISHGLNHINQTVKVSQPIANGYAHKVHECNVGIRRFAKGIKKVRMCIFKKTRTVRTHSLNNILTNNKGISSGVTSPTFELCMRSECANKSAIRNAKCS